MSENRVFTIPAANWYVFQDRVNALAARARKLGVEEPTFEVVDERTVEHTDDFGFVHGEVVRDVVVHGPEVKLGDYHLLAVIDIEPGADFHVVRTVPGVEKLAGWDTHDGSCDHCGLNRQRSKVVAVGSPDGVKVVGSTCLRDFLGHGTPENIAAIAELIVDLDGVGSNLDEDVDRPTGGGDFTLPALDVLAVVAATIRVDGWKSASSAREYGGQSTAAWALDLILDRRNEAVKAWHDENEVTDADRAKAAAAIEWAQSIERGSNDYLDNLNTVALREWIVPKDVGILASAITSHARELGFIERKEAAAKLGEKSEYVGEVKVRSTFGPLTCVAAITIESDYGSKTLQKFTDADGNVIVWWNSSSTDFEVGDVVEGKATVKSHEVYEGVKQTTVLRCAFTALSGPSKDAEEAAKVAAAEAAEAAKVGEEAWEIVKAAREAVKTELRSEGGDTAAWARGYTRSAIRAACVLSDSAEVNERVEGILALNHHD